MSICIICGEPAKLYSNKKRGYSKFCGKKCQSINNAINKIGKEYQDRDWWVEQRINQNKTIRQISNETGLSDVLITRYLRKFNIVSTDERRPNTEVNDILQSAKQMHQLYIVEGLKVVEIAERIGSSPATVSRWLKAHDIGTRMPNSYTRKHTKISKQEQEILDFVHSIYSGEVISGDRSVLNGRELDIYIPEKNFAIEVHGLFYHSYYPEGTTEALRKDRYYHQSKTNECEGKNIYLMQIYEDEWREKKELFKSMIRSRLGLNLNRVYARNCVVMHIDAETKDEFLDKNHAQGHDKSSLKLGLFHSGKLVSVITFVQKKFGKEYDWELNRFATLADHTIVGGFSKLFKAAIKCGVKGLVVSYADRRYSQGNVYEKNGFELAANGLPGYYYIKSPNYNQRFNRLSGTKEKLAKLGATGSTELEMAYSLGWRRIYDSGVKTYTINV